MGQQYVPRYIKPGDPLDPAPINDLMRENARQSRLRVGGKMRKRSGSGGVTVAYEPDQGPIDAVITANNGSGSYAYKQIYATSGGGWANGTPTGTCWERNVVATVPVGTYVQLFFCPSALEWRFQTSSC